MPEFYKETQDDFRPIPCDDFGENNQEWTHAILTREEFLEYLEDAKARFAAEARVENLEKALTAEREERLHQQGLNANLLRISKERANAERGLKPKKEHSGYAVLSSVERDHQYGTGKNRKTVRVWETTMQTPFPTDFTETQAKKESQILITADEEGHWPIQKIGIAAKSLKGYAAILAREDAESWLSRNVLIDMKFRANHKAGYWEILLLHTKSLGIVPEDMRPQSMSKEKQSAG